MLQISTNKLSQRKNVEIDGHHYIVRRMGAGDSLSVSQYMRELEVLVKKEEASSLSEDEKIRVGEIEKAILDISVKCFDDQEDGARARNLVENLSTDELAEIMEAIFNEDKDGPTEVS